MINWVCFFGDFLVISLIHYHCLAYGDFSIVKLGLFCIFLCFHNKYHPVMVNAQRGLDSIVNELPAGEICSPGPSGLDADSSESLCIIP